LDKRNFHDLRTRILEGSIVKTMLWLAWPIILGNLVNMSYNLVDAYWLGKLGREAFGAPTVSWPLIMFFYALGMGFSMAGISLVSQYVGSGDYEKTRKSIGFLITFMFITALIISLVGYSISPYILHLIGVPREVLYHAIEYIRVVFMGIPFVFLGFAFSFIASGLGDTRTPTYLGIVSSILNIFLDPIFIFGLNTPILDIPEMGVVGAALATIISRSFVSVAGLYLLVHGFRGIKLRINDLGVEGWWLKKIIVIGTPLVLQRSANSLGFVVMTSIVSSFGSVAIAAYGVAIRIIDVIQAFTWGLQRSASIMIGQNIGAEYYERAYIIVKKAILLIIAILTLGSLTIFLIRDQVIVIFINDPQVVAEGALLLSIFTWSIPFFGVFFIGNGVAAGSGHTLYMSILGIVRLWLLRIGLSYLLGIVWGYGTLGVWIGMTLSNVIAGVLALFWILSGVWAEKVID